MRWLQDAVDAWRSGTHRSQVMVLAALLVCVAVSLMVSLRRYELFPVTGYFLWLLVGMLLLRFGPLVLLASVATAAALVASFYAGPVTVARTSALIIYALSVLVVLYAASRQRSGLPSPLSEALLADLRDRLNAQGRVPALPPAWTAQSAMVAAHGVGYAGDFMVVDLRDEEQRLDIVLVDVVGKGVKAAPSALLLAGALGGMIGALRGPQLFDAANEFLLRQESVETFATAVHMSVDLATGSYTVLSAGHPPALRWSADEQWWMVDSSRGLALGIMHHPELVASHGVLELGDALLFYTDGVVESRTNDIGDGIAWLQETARVAVLHGVEGAARRIVDQVDRGDDDRAVLILSRGPDSVLERPVQDSSSHGLEHEVERDHGG